MSKPSTLHDLAEVFENSRISGDRVRGTCPICKATSAAWASIHADGGARVGCHSGPDHWREIRAAVGLEADGALEGHKFTPAVPEDEGPASLDMVDDAALLNAVYEVFARFLPMTSQQRTNFLARTRGIPRRILTRLTPLLAGLPKSPAELKRLRAHTVSEIRPLAPIEELHRVPELKRGRGNGLTPLPRRERAKYFEPWRDELGRTVALRAYMGRRERNKYLTSKGRHGPLLHFAFGCDRSRIDSVPWLFCEGWMKAEIAAHFFGCVAVAFAGVVQKQAWERAAAIKQRLAPVAPAHVAFDAEVWTTRPDFAKASIEFAWTLTRAGTPAVGYAVWATEKDAKGEPTPKGIDDAICDDVPVHLVSRTEFAACLGPALKEWDHGQAA